MPTLCTILYASEIGGEEGCEDHDFRHNEDPKTNLADVVAFERIRGCDLLTVTDEWQDLRTTNLQLQSR